ncbi:MAG TPA: helix-turn-helix transcriptional regulator [Polyangiaceae bacterium]|jgi:hypothetical protein
MRNPGNIGKTKGWAALVALLKETTQTELADELGLRQSALSDIVTLHKKASVQEVVALAKKGIAPELWTFPLAKITERRKGAA